MNKKNIELVQSKGLNLLPGVIIVIIQWILRFVLPPIFQSDMILQIGVFAGLLGGIAVLIWWAFFSRASRLEKWIAIISIIVAFFVTSQFIDISIKTTMMGLMFSVYSIPILSLTFVLWAVLSRKITGRLRYLIMIATIFISTGFWVLIRTDGMDAQTHQDFAWRWSTTAEEQLLAKGDQKLLSKTFDSLDVAREAEWSGFRGNKRDGIINGIQIKTNWKKTPPIELWRRKIGPGCSSFSVQGSFLFTQEQHGEFELVTCYNLKTGEPIWIHSDSARFWDSHAGAGPRSTPTIFNGRLYTLGATGILNVLNAQDGTLIWTRNAASDVNVKVLPWGFTSSPLVVNDIVIVALSGKLAGYNITDGKLAWFGSDEGNSYSSPHLVTIEGVKQILQMSKSGVISVEPANGKQLWKYDCLVGDRILQPGIISEGEFLIVKETKDLRRISVSFIQGNWKVKEQWISTEMKLNFNDVVINKGYIYGFDGPNLACMDIKDGKRKWKGNPYRGWLLLLADQNLLLILSEKGDVALVKASPDKFVELAKMPAIKGKTWNHPVMVGDVLVVRNNLEMAAFKLPLVKN